MLQTMNVGWDAPNGNRSLSARPQLEAFNEVYRGYAREHGLPLLDHYGALWRMVAPEARRSRKVPEVRAGWLASDEGGIVGDHMADNPELSGQIAARGPSSEIELCGPYGFRAVLSTFKPVSFSARSRCVTNVAPSGWPSRVSTRNNTWKNSA